MNYSTGSKGKGPVSAKFACGGEVITTRSRFMKVPDQFRTNIQKTDYGGKKDPLAKAEGDTKSEKPIKPHT
jgi:hypothetical protein